MNIPSPTTSELSAGPDICRPADAAPVACVDIGGTKVAVSVVDQRGIHQRRAEPTAKQGASDALAQQVLRMVGESCHAAQIRQEDIAAVGVASCGPFGSFWGQSPNSPSLRLTRRARCDAPQRNWCLTPITPEVLSPLREIDKWVRRRLRCYA